MVRSRHSLIEEEFERVKDLLHLVCRECLGPAQQMEVEATLGAMAAIANKHHDPPLRLHAEVTLGFWYHWKNLAPQAAMAWDALRQSGDLSEPEVGFRVVCAARAFCERARDNGDDRLRGIDELRRSVLEGKSRVKEAMIEENEEATLLRFLLQVLPDMMDLAARFRGAGEKDQVAELADHLQVVCVTESVAGAHHPLTLVPLKTLTDFLLNHELYDIASSLGAYATQVEKWNYDKIA
jgi:hypothetical protein